MKIIKLILIAIVGLPIALFVLTLVLGFILCLAPFASIGVFAWKYFQFRTEKERMRLKTQVKIAEMKKNSFSQID